MPENDEQRATTQAVFDFMNELRDSGRVNMFESPHHLMREFGFTKAQAEAWMWRWIEAQQNS